MVLVSLGHGSVAPHCEKRGPPRSAAMPEGGALTPGFGALQRAGQRHPCRTRFLEPVADLYLSGLDPAPSLGALLLEPMGRIRPEPPAGPLVAAEEMSRCIQCWTVLLSCVPKKMSPMSARDTRIARVSPRDGKKSLNSPMWMAANRIESRVMVSAREITSRRSKRPRNSTACW